MSPIYVEIFKTKPEQKFEHKLSVSKVKTFDDCKAKFKFSYIQKLPKKDWDHFLLGSFTHDILETFHQRLIDNSAHLDLKNKMGIQESQWPEIMKEMFKASLVRFPKINQEQKKEVFGILQQYLNVMREENARGTLCTVTDIEKEFYLGIDNKILLNGFIDRVQVDHDDVLHVMDYKTTKDKRYLKDFFQLETYAYILFLDDPNLQKIRGSFMCLRHDCDLLTKEYSRNDVEYIGEKFLKYADDMEQEKIYRPNPQFLCKYCDYVENCKEGENYLIKNGLLEKKEKMAFGMEKW